LSYVDTGTWTTWLFRHPPDTVSRVATAEHPTTVAITPLTLTDLTMRQQTPTHVRDLEQFVTQQSADGRNTPWYALCPTLSAVVTATRALDTTTRTPDSDTQTPGSATRAPEATPGASDTASTPTVRVLGPQKELRKAAQRFPADARLGAVTDDTGPRVVEARSFPPTLVGPTAVAVLVTARDAQCVSVADGARHDRLRDGAERAWADADDADVSLPSLDTVRRTAEHRLGPGFREDVETAVDVADSRSQDGVVDAVGAVLVAAAAHELLFRDVSRWIAHQNLASKATCSRRRNELTDADVVTTTEEATRPGRPILRCRLTDTARRRYESEGLRPLIEEHCL